MSGKRVWVAGHGGMVGAALVAWLQSENCEIFMVSREGLDLRDQAATRAWIAHNRPDVIVIAAAKVGGILANSTYPADFLYDNMMIEANIIHAAHEASVEKLLFLGSSCIYPKEAAQPIGEDALLTGALEPTNEAYAVAKIAGVKLCQAYREQYGRDFISAMPCNLYGPGDTFDEQGSHVIPALMMKAHAAKEAGADVLEVWGSGAPLREFLYVDDLADALVFLLKNYSGAMPVNIGAGEDMSIRELAEIVSETVGFTGYIAFDSSKPDGTHRKLMDSSRIRNAGWKAKTAFREGLSQTYQWYCEQIQAIKKKA
ncbi:MAG: GDP-L-fucose synthase [Rhodospirillales bacterium]|nr:GDP-L-fucose synthase [Alphaproteobacteria bacterium]MCB9981722.1 GDP-L-fucose synthase [Rhodospirillales bacterium]